MIAAAVALPADSPAYPTVTFHRARLLVESGQLSQARTVLTGMLARTGLSSSARNRLQDLRLRTARSLDDLVPDLDAHAAGLHADGFSYFRFAPTAPGCGYGDLGQGCDELRAIAARPQLMPRAAALVDGLPLTLIQKLASDSRLAESVRREITRGAWVRAFVEDDDAALRALSAELSAQEAEDSSLVDDLKRVEAAATSADRRFEAAWLLLRRPGMGPFVRPGLTRLTGMATIDNFGDNWWLQPRLTTPTDDDDEGGRFIVPAPFLDPEGRRLVVLEHRRLRAAGSAGSFMARTVVEEASARLDDPRVPEALYRAVRSTRLVGGGEWSRKAHTLLHQKFPRSPWTKRTPYWY